MLGQLAPTHKRKKLDFYSYHLQKNNSKRIIDLNVNSKTLRKKLGINLHGLELGKKKFRYNSKSTSDKGKKDIHRVH